MRINESVINSAVNKAIKRFLVSEKVVDKFTPYTPEEAENNKRGIGRMGNPSYDRAVKADTSVRDFGTPPSYKEWKDRYSKQMSYAEYAERKRNNERELYTC